MAAPPLQTAVNASSLFSTTSLTLHAKNDFLNTFGEVQKVALALVSRSQANIFSVSLSDVQLKPPSSSCLFTFGVTVVFFHEQMKCGSD